MKCWLGHTRADGFSKPVEIVRNKNWYAFTAYSKQEHICAHCGVHFSTIVKLDSHTMAMLKRKRK